MQGGTGGSGGDVRDQVPSQRAMSRRRRRDSSHRARKRRVQPTRARGSSSTGRNGAEESISWTNRANRKDSGARAADDRYAAGRTLALRNQLSPRILEHCQTNDTWSRRVAVALGPLISPVLLGHAWPTEGLVAHKPLINGVRKLRRRENLRPQIIRRSDSRTPHKTEMFLLGRPQNCIVRLLLNGRYDKLYSVQIFYDVRFDHPISYRSYSFFNLFFYIFQLLYQSLCGTLYGISSHYLAT